jgi:hypothetical protein
MEAHSIFSCMEADEMSPPPTENRFGSPSFLPRAVPRGAAGANEIADGAATLQIVGMVPPSMTYSLPVIEAARSEARKATSSATSAGQAGRPSGMPPRDCINCSRAPCRSVPEVSASRSISAVAAVVSVNPGATLTTRTPFRPTSFERPLL